MNPSTSRCIYKILQSFTCMLQQCHVPLLCRLKQIHRNTKLLNHMEFLFHLWSSFYKVGRKDSFEAPLSTTPQQNKIHKRMLGCQRVESKYIRKSPCLQYMPAYKRNICQSEDEPISAILHRSDSSMWRKMQLSEDSSFIFPYSQSLPIEIVFFSFLS